MQGAEQSPRRTPIRLPVNAPVALGIFILFLAGQTLVTMDLMDPPAHAGGLVLGLVWAGVLVHGLLLLFSTMLAAGWIAARLSPGGRASVWTILFVASTFFVWDYIGYHMVRLHLGNAMQLLWENVFTDMQIMRSRRVPLALITGGYLVLLAGGIVLLSRYEKRRKPEASGYTLRSLTIGVLSCLLLAVLFQAVLKQAVPRNIYDASVDGLLTVGRFNHTDDAIAGSLFQLKRAWFREPPRQEWQDLMPGETVASTLQRRPDIFIIVSDSLRREAISAETTPHLEAFSKKCLRIDKTVANANGTHPSLTAIVHGLHPLYHGIYFKKDDFPGALPLRVLKKLGYKIKVLASPDLEYFKFANVAFGKNRVLADEYLDQKDLLKRGARHPAAVDELIIEETIRGVSADETAPCFYFVLLDSTHFQYYWGEKSKPRYEPYMEKVPLIPVGLNQEQTEQLHNRYRNAVSYVDDLLGRFLAEMERRGKLDQSIIVVTGDHGEEFNERGNLVHGSELNHFQLEVPLFIHLPKAGMPGPERIRIASHVDIFPTIFDSLNVPGEFRKSLSGHSLIGTNPPKSAVSVISYWGGWVPVNLAIDLGEEKLMMDLLQPERLGRSFIARHLIGTKVVDAMDNELPRPATPAAHGFQAVPTNFVPALREWLVNP